jgi:flavorubredoxin
MRGIGYGVRPFGPEGEAAVNDPYQVAPDIYVLPSFAAIPEVGVLPVNAFVVLGDEPLLVDTGLRVESDRFMHALRSLIPPRELKYVLVTHDDADHAGSIERVMNGAPNAHLLVHALGALRLKFTFDIPLERVHAIVAGDQIPVGKRTFRVFRPPLFDNPTTLGLYDFQGRLMFSADTFGGILPRWSEQATEYSTEELAHAMLVWSTFDDPWVMHYERSAYAALLEEARGLNADLVLSSHLPPARGVFERLVTALEALPDAEPFVPPNQAAFAHIVAGMTKAAA